MNDNAAVAGLAWYRRDQWTRLRELAPDADKLDESYEDWLAGAQKLLFGWKSRVCALSVSTSTSTSWRAGVEPRVAHLTAPRGLHLSPRG